LRVNSQKARSNLGWKSKMKLEISIKWTVEWYKKYQEGKDMRKITEQQIEKYCNID